MADDRMTNDDLARNLGGQAGEGGRQPGQQSPGRHQQDDEKLPGGRGTTEKRDLEDDDLGGIGDRKPGQQEGQNR